MHKVEVNKMHKVEDKHATNCKSRWATRIDPKQQSGKQPLRSKNPYSSNLLTSRASSHALRTILALGQIQCNVPSRSSEGTLLEVPWSAKMAAWPLLNQNGCPL